MSIVNLAIVFSAGYGDNAALSRTKCKTETVILD